MNGLTGTAVGHDGVAAQTESGALIRDVRGEEQSAHVNTVFQLYCVSSERRQPDGDFRRTKKLAVANDAGWYVDIKAIVRDRVGRVRAKSTVGDMERAAVRKNETRPWHARLHILLARTSQFESFED